MSYEHTNLGFGSSYGPWRYRVLHGPELSAELARLSSARTLGRCDCVTLQPSPNPEHRSQDRYVVLEWKLANGTWLFTGVFDGHAGEETVDYVVEHLPPFVEQQLSLALREAGDSALPPHAVSSLLSEAISSFDNSIAQDMIDLFPGEPEALLKLSDQEIRNIINDQKSEYSNSLKVVRCMRGSTALVSLIDPSQENLWVASLGDCQAVLGAKTASGTWSSTLLSSNHNGMDQDEARRVRNEHPGESECILRNRVLGAIAVTRAIGDHLFKLPRLYTDRVFLNSSIGFRTSSRVEDFINRNLTPPYLSNQADVQHFDLLPSRGQDRCLILCSDGLVDLSEHRSGARSLQNMAEQWVSVLAKEGVSWQTDNLALTLLREALGGPNEKVVSSMLTVEMFERWMDDTTIIVQKL